MKKTLIALIVISLMLMSIVNAQVNIKVKEVSWLEAILHNFFQTFAVSPDPAKPGDKVTWSKGFGGLSCDKSCNFPYVYWSNWLCTYKDPNGNEEYSDWTESCCDCSVIIECEYDLPTDTKPGEWTVNYLGVVDDYLGCTLESGSEGFSVEVVVTCTDPDGNILKVGENYVICETEYKLGKFVNTGYMLKMECQSDGSFEQVDKYWNDIGCPTDVVTCEDPDGNILKVGENYVTCEKDLSDKNTGYMLKYECQSSGFFTQVDKYWNDIGCPPSVTTCTDPDGNVLEVGENYVICEKDWLGKNTGFMFKYECQSDGSFKEVDKYKNEIGCPPPEVTCTDPDGNVLQVGQNYVTCEKGLLGGNTGYMLKYECQSNGQFKVVDKYENEVGCPTGDDDEEKDPIAKLLEDYPWLIIIIPAGVGYFLPKNKQKKKKFLVYGGIIGLVLYYLYNLAWWQQWILGLGLVGGFAIFIYLGGGALILYLLMRRSK